MSESLKQVLVHLDATARGAMRLKVARAIAQGQGAAVTALYAVTPALLEVPYTPEAGPNVAAALREIDEQRRAAARTAWDRQQSEPGPGVGWAEVSDYPIVASFARQALYADLLVLGQYDADDRDSAGVPADFRRIGDGRERQAGADPAVRAGRMRRWARSLPSPGSPRAKPRAPWPPRCRCFNARARCT